MSRIAATTVPSTDRVAQLSPRQREILTLVAAGRTSKEIAGQLGISESTVNWHISNVFGRLGASSRAEAVALAIRDEADRHNNGNGTEGADGVGRVSGEVAPPPARRPAAPLVPTASVVLVALTLLLGLLGGALVAGWQVTLTPPSPTAMPNGPAPTVAPTARPSGALAPQPRSTDAVPPERSREQGGEAHATSVPATSALPSPAFGAPALGPIAPLVPPLPTGAEVPTLIPAVSAAPTLVPAPSPPLVAPSFP
jgi:DNA-binding CsgD family transcriptional regulator